MKVKTLIKKEINETKLLFKGLPAIPFALVCLSFIVMNLLATVPLFQTKWIAGDVGIIVSWLSFMVGDMFVKRYGAKGSIKINLTALLVALLTMSLLAAGSAIEIAKFGENYCLGLFNWTFDLEHGAVTLWTLGSSAAAFIIATLFNSFVSKYILTKFKEKTSFKAYAAAAYGSTFVGQFVDNIVFALSFTFIASRIPEMQTAWSLEPLTVLAAIVCALTGAVLELIFEVVFSPVGYKIAERWRRDGVGAEYVAQVPDAQEVNTNTDCVVDIVG